MIEASRELLAPREDVWRFLAEPYHLTDWWPGITGVVPDRRGFAAGARWEVALTEGRSSGSRVSATLLVTSVSMYEEWTWQLIRRGRTLRVFRPIEVEVRLRSIDRERTLVTVSVHAPDALSRLLFRAQDERKAGAAVNRLYDLVQTAATL